MKKHYPLFALSVTFALCGHLLFAQEGGPFSRITLLHSQTGLQAYKTARRWRGLDLAQFFGTGNTATGTSALSACTSCYQNVADGYQVLAACTTCYDNVGVGYQALAFLTTGSNNTALGWAALDVTTSSANTAVGFGAMEANTTGSWNTALGDGALGTNTGNNDVAIGISAFGNAMGESYSTMVGALAGAYQKSSNGYNTAIGYEALLGGAGVSGV